MSSGSGCIRAGDVRQSLALCPEAAGPTAAVIRRPIRRAYVCPVKAVHDAYWQRSAPRSNPNSDWESSDERRCLARRVWKRAGVSSTDPEVSFREKERVSEGAYHERVPLSLAAVYLHVWQTRALSRGFQLLWQYHGSLSPMADEIVSPVARELVQKLHRLTLHQLCLHPDFARQLRLC